MTNSRLLWKCSKTKKEHGKSTKHGDYYYIYMCISIFISKQLTWKSPDYNNNTKCMRSKAFGGKLSQMYTKESKMSWKLPAFVLTQEWLKLNAILLWLANGCMMTATKIKPTGTIHRFNFVTRNAIAWVGSIINCTLWYFPLKVFFVSNCCSIISPTHKSYILRWSLTWDPVPRSARCYPWFLSPGVSACPVSNLEIKHMEQRA